MSGTAVALIAGAVVLAALALLLPGAARISKTAARYGMRIFMPLHLGLFGIPTALLSLASILPAELREIVAPLIVPSFLIWLAPVLRILRRMGIQGVGLCIVQALVGMGLGITVIAVVIAVVAEVAGLVGMEAAHQAEIQALIDEERRQNEARGIEGPGEFERKMESLRALEDD